MLKCFVESKKTRIYMYTLLEYFDICEKKIVPATAIQELLAEPTCFKETLDGKTYKVLRFLLKTTGELVFAHEGAPGGLVPSHWRMSATNPLDAQCISAGNVFFNENEKLEILNNKSGDFKPVFNSLQFVFPELLKTRLPMSEVIEVIQLNINGAEITSHRVKFEEILEFCKLPYLHEPLQEEVSDFEFNKGGLGLPAVNAQELSNDVYAQTSAESEPNRQSSQVLYSFFPSNETLLEEEHPGQLTTIAYSSSKF